MSVEVAYSLFINSKGMNLSYIVKERHKAHMWLVFNIFNRYGSMEDLLSLPGVGRKIANLILGDVFHKGGIVADTHCMRICGRLGFYPEEQKDPVKTERIMTPLIPLEEQSDFCHRLVQFGRDVCTARSPKCTSCPLGDICLHNSKKL